MQQSFTVSNQLSLFSICFLDQNRLEEAAENISSCIESHKEAIMELPRLNVLPAAEVRLFTCDFGNGFLIEAIPRMSIHFCMRDLVGPAQDVTVDAVWLK